MEDIEGWISIYKSMFKEALNYTFFVSTPSIDGVDTAMVRARELMEHRLDTE